LTAYVAYLLDTNIVIHAVDGSPSVLEKMAELGGEIVLSSLCYAELQRGYRLRDRVLRPSLVAVAKAPTKEQ